MKFRLAAPHLSHGPMRFGRRWRGHELPLRLVQLALLIVIGGIAARLTAELVAWVVHGIAGILG